MCNNDNEIALSFGEDTLKTMDATIPQTSFDESLMTKEDLDKIEAFSNQIELSNSGLILQYGAEAQKKMSDFSEKALGDVRMKDLGEVGGMISDVVIELKKFDAIEEASGIKKFLKKSANRMTVMKTKYDKASTNVDKVTSLLENHQMQLLKDVQLLDHMYDLNKTNYKELTMYIMAGEKKIQQVRDNDLAALIEKATKSGLAEHSQLVNDLKNQLERFDKKIHDLKVTRQMSLMMAPQIRMIQNNDTLMAEKLHSTVINVVPLWKNQMLIALGINHASEVAKTHKQVTDMTNELLKKNAQALKQSTIEVAKESERSIIDIETLKSTNDALITTFDEVMAIQADGRAKRALAEEEMLQMEQDLKDKLLNNN